MDIKKKSTKSTKSTKSILFLAVVSILVLISYLNRSDTQTMKKSDIIIGVVNKGNFQIEVQGYGKFISNKQKIITSLSDATVKEIFIRPGNKVNENSIIAKLENPELLQKYNNEIQELSQVNANLRQLKLNHRRNLLNEESKFEDLVAKSQISNLYVVAHEKLVESGTISKITYESRKLESKLFDKQVVIQKQRINQLNLSNNEEINIQLEKIKQQEDILNIAKNKLEGLVITAGMEGVLQRLSIELGQSISQGQEIALIGSTEDLIAIIRVPQIRANMIKIDQVAKIDTHQGLIQGRIARIDPRVENNTVSVEVEFLEKLPKSVRPEMNVEGVIIVERLNDVYYIDRPVNSISNSNGTLYKVLKTQNRAQRQQVQFGKGSDKMIEILSKVMIGDEFILSDLPNVKLDEFIILD